MTQTAHPLSPPAKRSDKDPLAGNWPTFAQTLAVPVNTRLIHHFPSTIDLRGLVVGENSFEVLDHSDYRIVAELTMSDLTQSIFTIKS